MTDELDSIESLQAKKTEHKLPLGWVLLFVGLIAWGVAYLWLYMPALGGWSQGKAYQEAVAPPSK